MASFPNLLTSLQRRVLDLVSGRLADSFLTGGTALGAFHLGHRRSEDLDLFTRDAEAYDRRVREFLVLAEGAGLTVVPGHAGPGFRRFVVSDGRESLPVDIVLDTASPVGTPTVMPDGLVIDSLEDITANKLGAIVGRAEARDYIDLYFIAQSGRDPLTFLPDAQRKDAGIDAATLAFVLSDVKVNRVPAGLERPVTAEQLQSFIDDLRRRLAEKAFPRPA